MSVRSKISAIILIAIICAFSYGLYRLFMLRFDKGDIYPPYSSLRSDPLGSKAFYGSLGRVSGISTRRNFLEPSKLAGERGRTIFFLGVDANRIDLVSEKQADDFSALVVNGNRLVIAFAPARGEPSGKQPGENARVPQKDRKDGGPCGCLFRKWGIAAERLALPPDSRNNPTQAVSAGGETDLPATVSWHSDLFFRIGDGRWHAVYAVAGNPVVIERAMGRGSVVMLSDSYLTSNEAMRNERRTHLLAWLQGPNRVAVFDENHLGVGDTPGIMSLARKYRLEPFLLGLIILAGLYLWKSSVPLVPRSGPSLTGPDGNPTGRDNFDGLVSLLRRCAAPQALLDVCFREWSKAFSRGGKVPASTLERVRSVLDDERSATRSDHDPVRGYKKISKILTERKYR